MILFFLIVVTGVLVRNYTIYTKLRYDMTIFQHLALVYRRTLCHIGVHDRAEVCVCGWREDYTK